MPTYQEALKTIKGLQDGFEAMTAYLKNLAHTVNPEQEMIEYAKELSSIKEHLHITYNKVVKACELYKVNQIEETNEGAVCINLMPIIKELCLTELSIAYGLCPTEALELTAGNIDL
jgi:hypothetical protein